MFKKRLDQAEVGLQRKYLRIRLNFSRHEEQTCHLISIPTCSALCDAQEGSPFALHIALDSDDEDDSDDEGEEEDDDEEEEVDGKGAVDVDVSQIELQNISLRDPERGEGEGTRAAGERLYTSLLPTHTSMRDLASITPPCSV